jgi:hypothetical protein
VSTANWDRVQGDVNDTLVARLDGVANLTGVSTIVGHVWQRGVTSVNLTATVLDATARTVTVQLSPWLNSATPGVWKFELQATWTAGPVTVTWRDATITVYKQGS